MPDRSKFLFLITFFTVTPSSNISNSFANTLLQGPIYPETMVEGSVPQQHKLSTLYGYYPTEYVCIIYMALFGLTGGVSDCSSS